MEVKGGQTRKYQVTDNDFSYPERLGRLEQSNGALKSAQTQLLEEESTQDKAKLGDKVDIEPRTRAVTGVERKVASPVIYESLYYF